MGYFLFWFFLSIAIGIAGSNRSIGFWGAFFLSLFFSPLIGLIITFSTKSKSEAEIKNIHEKQLHKISELVDYQDSTNNIDKLLEAKSLLDSGLISTEEFEKIKEIILPKKIEKKEHLFKFKVGNMVVDKDGNNMRIIKLNDDGTYQCATNMGMTDAGSFNEQDIKLREY